MRIIGSGVASLALTLLVSASALAAAPQVYTWTNPVDVPYFSCDTFEVNGVWTVSHRLTVFLDGAGNPVRDIEKVDFVGAFVNQETGASIADSGHIVWFDTLDADGNYLTTVSNSVRLNRYLHSAGRDDFQTGAFHGRNGWDGIDAACAALGG
jgi:hypothetical protein